MQLVIVLAIVLAISISEAAPAEPVSHVGWRLLLAIVATAIAPLFAATTSNAIVRSLRGETICRSETMHWFDRLRLVHAIVWLLVGAVVLQQLGWVRLVRFNWQLDRLILIDDLLVLMPLLASLLLSWVAFHRVACAVRPAARPSLAEYLAWQVRHHLALIMVPVLLVLAAHDVAQLAEPNLPPFAIASLLLLPVAGMVVFFPLVVRAVWKTEPMPNDALGNRLTAFAERTGFREGQWFIWNTDGNMVNAAVTGLLRPWRYVFFSDALLERFTEDEIETVLAHEVGHIRRHHLAWRVLAIIVPVLACFVFGRVFPEVPAVAMRLSTAIGLNGDLLAVVAGPIALLIYALTLFAAHSRLLEHDADLVAARLCAHSDADGSGYERVAHTLDKLACVGGPGHDTRSWLHPTITDRIGFLLDAAERPQAAKRFERRMAVGHRCLLVAAALLLALLLALAE